VKFTGGTCCGGKLTDLCKGALWHSNSGKSVAGNNTAYERGEERFVAHKQDRVQTGMIREKTADRIRISSWYKFLPGSGTIILPEASGNDSCRFLRPDERACRDQVEPESLCRHPVTGCTNLLTPLLRQPAVRIVKALPGVFRLPVSQQVNIHKSTISMDKDKKIVENYSKSR
jgi:hypothetical protein